MPLRKFDPVSLYPAHGLYFNAVEVPAGLTVVYSSGIIGAEADGRVIPEAEGQIRQAWRNVRTFLEDIGAEPRDLVRLKMHLTDRDNLALSKAARIEALGEHMNAAVTGVIVELFDPGLFVEIDVIAAVPEAAAPAE
ncbi:MAG: RidA family protein [Pseudomonadota bacterium]